MATRRPQERIGVIGAGILGVAVARRIQQLRPGAAISVVEKERTVGAHQTGHNSGVVHAGLYYAPGSLKADLCTRGRVLLQRFCAERALPFEACGKLVVALDQSELAGLRGIAKRARQNGVPDLRWLGSRQLQDVEPHVRGAAALHSPHTAITDFAAVAAELAADVETGGGAVHLGEKVTGIDVAGGLARVTTAAGREWEFDRVVVCAGLYADRLAGLGGDGPDPRIVPFRGEYLRLVPARRHLVRGLVYPVPDPRYPFLGVHFTRRVDGSVDVGPNAVLALSREGYRWRDVNGRDVADMARWPGAWRMARQHWRAGAYELWGSWSRRAFVARARRYVPELARRDVDRAGAGVRAQAVSADGALVDDFRIGRVGAMVTVRNAPSPGATSSLAIAEHVAALALDS